MAHRLPLPITSALFGDYNYKLPITLTARFGWPEARLLVISNAHPYSLRPARALPAGLDVGSLPGRAAGLAVGKPATHWLAASFSQLSLSQLLDQWLLASTCAKIAGGPV